MRSLIKSKAEGLRGQLSVFYKKVEALKLTEENLEGFTDLAAAEMKSLSFDKITKDRAGNLIGLVKGHANKEPIVVVSHIDIMTPADRRLEGVDDDGMVRFKAGVISSIYAGAVLKRSLSPLTGDLIICCVPRLGSCDYGIKCLFDGYLKTKVKRIKGVILSEPTGFQVHLGHKGRMEYEIVVKGRLNKNFVENRGMNMLGTMFPLISELEKVSKELPSDFNLGRSDLRIKDVSYGGYEPQNEMNEFKIVVDRVFIPEESEDFILNKAKTIAKSVYSREPDVAVNTLLSKERVKTYTGLELVAEKEFKPWSMDGHAPFAMGSLAALSENGFKTRFGYWKKIVTEGS
ncbi:MAG TPA: hypothetical protein PLV52_03975, partial [Candidatus Omnitrophota bacterium]|nr:hypothetical protein [Candidatus Omnitrophota bacterium]